MKGSYSTSSSVTIIIIIFDMISACSAHLKVGMAKNYGVLFRKYVLMKNDLILPYQFYETFPAGLGCGEYRYNII